MSEAYSQPTIHEFLITLHIRLQEDTSGFSFPIYLQTSRASRRGEEENQFP